MFVVSSELKLKIPRKQMKKIHMCQKVDKNIPDSNTPGKNCPIGSELGGTGGMYSLPYLIM